MKKIFALIAVVTMQLGWTGGQASAQQFPSRPIRVIVPFDAGGAMDVIMRFVAKKVGENGDATIVIENKTGAGGAIGVMAVKNAAPDGYTLVETSSSTHVLNPYTTATIPYDPVKDFQPVVMLVRVPTLLAVPASSPVKNFADLVEYAHKKPGGLSYGSAGVGSQPHVVAALLAKSIGTPMTHIPYRGLAGAMTDLVGGRLDFVFSSIPSLAGHVTDGKVRLLAVSGNKRLKQYPDLPSMADLGRPEVSVDLWFGIEAPLGTDPAIVNKLNAIFTKAANDPELGASFAKLGVEIATGTPEEFGQAIASDNARLGPVIKQLMSEKK